MRTHYIATDGKRFSLHDTYQGALERATELARSMAGNRPLHVVRESRLRESIRPQGDDDAGEQWPAILIRED